MPQANLITKTAKELADRCTLISGSYKERSWQARWGRRAQNLANWNALYSKMDWSHKLPWQTQQTISEFGISIEQAVGTLERGLTDTEDWLTVDAVGIGDPVMDPEIIAALLKYYLERLWVPGDGPETSYNVANLIGDGVKRGLLESIITLKVMPKLCTKYQYRLEHSKPKRGKFGYREDLSAYDLTKSGRPTVVTDTIEDFRLCVELVPWEDWYPDPSLLNKYVIHEVTTHLSDLAANPDYDPVVIDAIKGTANATYADMYKRVTQNIVFIQHDPDEVRVQEFWGDLIDPDTGEVLATNSFWTTCNGRLLRPPTPNPFWHGKRPFVSAPLLRTPNSTIHKALADDAVDSWQFLNELISLMFDGALASVWGKGQMRSDYVENSDDFTEGIPQAATFMLRPNTPEGYKAWEKLETGELPNYAMEIFNLAMRQFQTAMATNDLRLGQQPPREATACVPMYSEALTRRGWKHYEDLIGGEDILAFNPVTQKCEWTPIETLAMYEAAETRLYHNREWRVVCTPNHKWASQQYDAHNGCRKGDIQLRPIEEMPAIQNIWTTACAPDGVGLQGDEPLLDRNALPQVVLRMTSEERRAFIIGMMAGEGFQRDDQYGQQIFTQNEGPVLDAFRIACFMEGIRTGTGTKTRNAPTTTYNCTLYKSPFVWREKLQVYDAGVQAVWCPQTAFGTWVMRQGQTITITGNTSIVEAMQASGSLFEAIAARVEDTVLDPMFELAWLTILQYENDHKLVDPVLVQILGPDRVLALTQMSNEERFTVLAQSAKFRCRGLRGVTARNRVMTKLTNLLQLISTSPDLMGLFQQNYSMSRLMEQLLRNSGVNPTTLEKTQEEKDADEAAAMVQESLNAGQVTQPGGGPPPPAAQANAGSPASLVNASQDQQEMSGAMAPKTPSAQIPGAPQPGVV